MSEDSIGIRIDRGAWGCLLSYVFKECLLEERIELEFKNGGRDSVMLISWKIWVVEVLENE